MTYRDEVAALKSKLDDAESELFLLRKENDALRKGIAPQIADGGQFASLLGAPTRLRVERTLDGELSNVAHRELASIARRAIGRRGSVISLGSTLLVRVRGRREARLFQLRVWAKNGKTQIVVEEDLAQVAGGIFGGIGGGAGFGGLGAILPGLTLAISPWVGLFAGPLWLGLVYGLSRVVYGSIVERRKTGHINLVAEIARAAQANLDVAREAAAPRVRVAGSHGESTSVETESTDEADAPRSAKKARAEGA